MAFKFIDNQPMRFNSSKFDDQGCINKDLSAYNILMQPGDPLHWQAKLVCCDENDACDPTTEGAEMITDGNMSNPAAFAAGTGWVVAAGVATFTANGTNVGVLSQNIGNAVGNQYIARINIVSNDTGKECEIYLGARRIANISGTGLVEIYGQSGTVGNIYVRLNTDYSIATSGTLVIDDLSLKEVATCYTFDTSTREYVVNGSFAVATPWIYGTGWAWNAGLFAEHTTGNIGQLSEAGVAVGRNHSDILWAITITGRTVGSIGFEYGNVIMQSGITATTSFNYPAYNLVDQTLDINPTSDFDGDVDNISARETLSGWDYTPESGFCHTVGWANPFYAGATLTVGRYYKLTVEIIVNAAQVLVEAGGVTLGIVSETGVHAFYFTALTTAGEKFTPSGFFDGCILPNIDLCYLFINNLETRLVYQDGITGATDWHTVSSSSNPLILDGDWLTWRINSLAAILSGGVPVALNYSCYRMQVKIVCEVLGAPVETITTSDTVINYAATQPCTKMFMAYCEGDDLDFRFGYQGNMFRIYSRLRTLYFNPGYPVDVQDYNFSSGLKKRVYAELTKTYELLFDYMDEYAHDVVWLFHGCDYLYIDNVNHIITSGNYEPEWADRGKRNLAQSIIELQKSDGIIFNRNCS